MSAVMSALKSVLARVGLLDVARSAGRRLHLYRLQRYHCSIVRTYRSPFARPIESYAAFEQRERRRSEEAALIRFHRDRQAVLTCAFTLFGTSDRAQLPGVLAARYGSDEAVTSMVSALGALDGLDQIVTPPLPGRFGSAMPFDEDRRTLTRALLDSLVDKRLAPRFYDYDYLEDVVGIAGGRYCTDDGCGAQYTTAALRALSILSGTEHDNCHALSGRLTHLLGRDHGYVPTRGDVMQHVRNVIPELTDEFIALKAERNVTRFLEINREYSRRQAHTLGTWDVRALSLLRGYERDHHLLLRTLIDLMQSGRLSAADDVLLVGPRHIDEVVFFRKVLGLRRAIGLDLFPFGKDEIVGGDMHQMPFESNRFRVVFCAGTLSYSFNVRRVIDEMARVTKRPGYVFLVDAGGRHGGANALGRSDIPCAEAMIGLFYRNRFRVLAKDAGKSLAPELYENEPCVAIELEPGVGPLQELAPGGSANFLRSLE